MPERVPALSRIDVAVARICMSLKRVLEVTALALFCFLALTQASAQTGPIITTQPQSQILLRGATATFSVSATGIGTLNYQWTFAGTNISGATQSSLIILNVQSNNAGAYQVAVSDILGTTLSAVATLDVLPAVIADYTFEGTGNDSVSNSFPMQLINTEFVNGTLFLNGLYELGDTNGFRAIAMINGFSYNSFAVALDFNPIAFGTNQNNILMGGAGYRWLGYDYNAGHLEITWNNHGSNHLFTNSVVVTNQWQKLVCSVDLVQDRIITFLNGTRLEDILLPPGFQFNVQGTPNEPNEKNFTFTDYANGQVFYGYADNLLVFGGALTPAEIATVVGGPPVLLTQPQSQVVPPGGTAQFSVLATGSLPLSYQWLFDGATISAATNSSYTLANVQSTDQGAYQVVVTNSYGSNTSSIAILALQAPPVIVVQPQSLTVAAGAPAALSVVAVGTEPLSYKWYFNGAVLSGATNSTLVFPNVYFGNGGHYQVVVANEFGSVASSVATLSVITAPVILHPPDSAQVAVGDTAVFNVMASSSGPLTYQWFFEDSAVSGATRSSFAITNAQFTDAGNYSVLVSSLAGSVLSPQATLLVVPAVAPPLILSSYTLQLRTGLNLIANQLDRGGNTLAEILPVVPNGTVVSKYDNLNGVWGQATYSNSWGPAGILSLNPGEGAWLRSLTNFTISLLGTPHTSNIPLSIPGGVTWLVSRQTNAPGSYENIVGAAPAPGVEVFQWINSNTTFAAFTYTITGWSGGIEPVAQIGESLWIAPTGGEPVPTPVRPLITQQPLSVTLGLGGPALFLVAASGTEPLNYQWRLNGNAIPGATTTILSIGSVQPANAGNYDVVVNNAIGITESAIATLTISNLITLPFADDFENAGSLGIAIAGTGFGQNVGATLETNEPPADDLPGGASVWLRWQAPADGVAIFTTAGSDFDTVLAAYTLNGPLSITNLVGVAADDDSAEFLCSLINFNASAGTTYFLQVDGFHGATGEIHLSWSFVPTVTTPPVVLIQPRGETVVAGSNLTLFVVVQAGPPVSYQWFSNNIPLPGQTDSALTLSPARAGIYVVGVTNTRTGAGLSSSAADIQVIIPGAGQRGNPVNVRSEDKFLAATDLTPPDPNILHDPATASGFTDTQTFSTVNATADPTEPAHCGNTPCKSVWNSYSNQVSGTLTIDTHGTTFNAILEVYTGPGDSFATLVPVACSANHGAAGESVTFPANGGTTYWVVVDGVNCAAGNVTLNYNLVAIPSFTASPVSRTVAAGTQVTLSGSVVGAPTLRYQWRFNGTNISGATGSSLTMSSFQSASQGNYSVVCFNSYGSVTSLTAQVLLNNPRFINTVKSGSSLQTTFVGLSYTNYIIEASSNLTTWFPTKTNSSAIGVFNFTDPLPPAQPRRFYRGRQR
jgi:hypothetical protein